MRDDNPNPTADQSGGSQPSRPPTFTFGGTPKRSTYVAIALGVVLGPTLVVAAVYVFFTGDGAGRPPTTYQAIASIIILLLGILFGFPAYISVFRWKRLTRHMHLVFNRVDLQYWIESQKLFVLPWSEISHIKLKVQPSRTADNIEHPVLYRADRTMSAIEIHPVSPDHFQRAHPEMKRFQKLSEDYVYRVHLGQGTERAQQADVFLHQGAPSLYAGHEKVRSLILN